MLLKAVEGICAGPEPRDHWASQRTLHSVLRHRIHLHPGLQSDRPDSRVRIADGRADRAAGLRDLLVSVLPHAGIQARRD